MNSIERDIQTCIVSTFRPGDCGPCLASSVATESKECVTEIAVPTMDTIMHRGLGGLHKRVRMEAWRTEQLECISLLRGGSMA